jgi:hypothetical protein
VRSVNVTPELKEFGNTRRILPADRRGTRLATYRLEAAERPISAQEAPNVSTALIPIAASDAAASVGDIGARPRANFLAQLIATAAKAPQTRVRRRAEPGEAIAAYGAIDRSSVPQPALSRSL